MPLEFRPAVSRDLDRLIEWSVQMEGDTEGLLAALHQEFVSIGSFPLAYPRRRKHGIGVRIATVRQYLILFRLTDEDVLIERVLHAASDLSDLSV